MMIDERDVEGYLGQRVKEIGGLCLKLDSGSKKGIQDRLLLLPGGRVVLVELKRTGGRVSDLQKVRQKQIERLGFQTCVVWDKAAVDALLNNI